MNNSNITIWVLLVFCAFWAGFWLNHMMSTGKEDTAQVGSGSYSNGLQKQIDTLNEQSDELLKMSQNKGGSDGISE